MRETVPASIVRAIRGAAGHFHFDGRMMFFKTRRNLSVARFNWQTRGILDTPPLAMTDGKAPLVFASLVSHADIQMYLVAIKSIYRAVGFGGIEIVSDGSLSADDESLLRRHLPRIKIHRIADIDPSPCPRGGCWERLWFILGRATDSYVIQVDSDTVTCAPIPEVVDCVLANRSFVLGTRDGLALTTVGQSAQFASRYPADHVQMAAEQVIDRLPDAEALRYVRGSAGFSGFARGGFSRERLVAFSTAMQSELPTRWTEWGTEQMASNFAVSNSPSAMVLPHPKYSCFDLKMDPDQAAFLHFIGTNRFDAGIYAREARKVIDRLNRA